uniref:Transposase IS204/IS1001/IS1096/IS1165 DDE domain-containing protein n=1 Tax=Cupriavidus taiwanensis TaxID=164546 RepID=A0A375H9X4_9BURK|nr:protein of unknown function [Cupriavidus taiwanensis]
MTTAYELEILEHFPQAEVVYDLFHVVAKYGCEVMDRVRVDQANRLRHDRPTRRVLKSTRWLLQRNQQNLSAPQAVHLDEVLQANRPLMTAYILRDDSSGCGSNADRDGRRRPRSSGRAGMAELHSCPQCSPSA